MAYQCAGEVKAGIFTGGGIRFKGICDTIIKYHKKQREHEKGRSHLLPTDTGNNKVSYKLNGRKKRKGEIHLTTQGGRVGQEGYLGRTDEYEI